MRKSRLQETSMEVTVGAFMFMVLLALGFFTIILSRENIFTRSYSLRVLFDNVKGLREGDNVFVRGVDVGKIRTLQITPRGVEVKVTLDQPVRLREDYRIEILPSSVLGGRYLNIHEGTERAPPLASAQEVRGLTPVDLIDEATRTTQMIKEALENGGILENLKTTMAQAKELTTKLNQGEGTLGKLLADDQVYNDLQEISGNLKGVSRRLAEGKGTLGKLLSEDDTLYRDLEEAAASIRSVTETISSGEGTLGKLARDDELYEEAKLLLHEIRAAVDDIREVTPITTFTSIFFGAF
jgi:phospholipid/cholesterol/gamma-HCH transport system substrate-binding protein